MYSYVCVCILSFNPSITVRFRYASTCSRFTFPSCVDCLFLHALVCLSHFLPYTTFLGCHVLCGIEFPLEAESPSSSPFATCSPFWISSPLLSPIVTAHRFLLRHVAPWFHISSPCTASGICMGQGRDERWQEVAFRLSDASQGGEGTGLEGKETNSNLQLLRTEAGDGKGDMAYTCARGLSAQVEFSRF